MQAIFLASTSLYGTVTCFAACLVSTFVALTISCRYLLRRLRDVVAGTSNITASFFHQGVINVCLPHTFLRTVSCYLKALFQALFPKMHSVKDLFTVIDCYDRDDRALAYLYKNT